MPPPRRFAGVLMNRCIPWRTRVDLLGVELRRRLRPLSDYRVRYRRGSLFLSHDDYEVDWETLKNTLVDDPYLAVYGGAVVLDIGAHMGYYGAYVLAHGAHAVVSYEPEEANAALLERSALSVDPSGEHWRVERAAVSASRGEAELHDELLVEAHPWAACGADELAAHVAPAGLERITSRHERMLQLRRGSPRAG